MGKVNAALDHWPRLSGVKDDNREAAGWYMVGRLQTTWLCAVAAADIKHLKTRYSMLCERERELEELHAFSLRFQRVQRAMFVLRSEAIWSFWAREASRRRGKFDMVCAAAFEAVDAAGSLVTKQSSMASSLIYCGCTSLSLSVYYTRMNGPFSLFACKFMGTERCCRVFKNGLQYKYTGFCPMNT